MKPNLQEILRRGFRFTGIFLGMDRTQEIYHKEFERKIYDRVHDEVIKSYDADMKFERGKSGNN